MGITEQIVVLINHYITIGGHTAIVFLMMLESMVVPVPSEAVMPFVGYLTTTHVFNFWYALLSSIVGSMVGSLISYYVGYYGGRPFLRRWGKYLLLNEHHLDQTEKFFQSRGEITIFISRFIPVVRHLISVPAGTGKMNIFKFSFYTLIGAGMWNAILMYVGMVLGNNWSKFGHYNKILDVIVVVVILLAVGYWIYKRKNKNGNNKIETP